MKTGCKINKIRANCQTIRPLSFSPFHLFTFSSFYLFTFSHSVVKKPTWIFPFLSSCFTKAFSDFGVTCRM